jgi:hypothetical protein
LASAAVAAVQRNQVRKAQAVNGGKDGTAAQNTAATANRGGGGGGTGNDSTIASSGGSGVVVIRQAANAKFPTTLTNATHKFDFQLHRVFIQYQRFYWVVVMTNTYAFIVDRHCGKVLLLS